MLAIKWKIRYVAAGAVAVALYMFSYYVNVEREEVSLCLALMKPRMDMRGVQPKYRVCNDLLTIVFTPAHTIDRLIRPEFWRVENEAEVGSRPDVDLKNWKFE